MFTKKAEKRIQAVPWAALALCTALVMWALVMAAWPETAQAQTPAESRTTEVTDRSPRGAGAAERAVVVEPGDSLWSISQRHLGPNATPRRIAEGAERIHALNRGRIGADPDLIFVGQELLVLPAMSERSPGSAPARKTTHAAETGPGDRAAEGTTGEARKPAPRTAPGEADTEGGGAPKTAAHRGGEPAALPKVAAVAPVPAARTLAGSFLEVPADAGAEGRRLLGLGVLALTLVVAALMAWKLPMRRTIRGDAERWGRSSGYHGYHGKTPAASRNASFFHRPGSLGGTPGDRDERDARREALLVPGRGRHAVLVSGGTAPSPGVARKTGVPAGRGRTPRAKDKAGAVPRNGLAVGAHNPKVRRAPRRVRATMRARILRPRRRPRGGAARRPVLPPAITGHGQRWR